MYTDFEDELKQLKQMLIWLSITFSMGTLQMCHAVFMLGGGDLNHNHFHGYITAEPCEMLVIWNTVIDFMGTLLLSHVRCWWFESQSLISWVHYILAMLDVGDLNLSQWFSGYFAGEPCQVMVIWISVSDSVGTLQMNQVLTVLSRCLTEPQKKQLLSVLGQELQGSRYTWLMSCIYLFWQLSSQENKHWSWV